MLSSDELLSFQRATANLSPRQSLAQTPPVMGSYGLAVTVTLKSPARFPPQLPLQIYHNVDLKPDFFTFPSFLFSQFHSQHSKCCSPLMPVSIVKQDKKAKAKGESKSKAVPS